MSDDGRREARSYFLLEPLDQFLQRLSTMRDLVLLCFGHLGICLAFVLKARIPACVCQSWKHLVMEDNTHRNQLVRDTRRSCPTLLSISALRNQTGMGTYFSPSLKNNRLCTWSLAVCERAYSLRRLILKTRQQLMELLNSQCLQEPFPMQILALAREFVVVDVAYT